MRYTATFSFDADDFASARRIARGFRSTLRNENSEFHTWDTKLRKLVDPAAAQAQTDTEPESATAPAVATVSVSGTPQAVNDVLASLMFSNADVDVQRVSGDNLGDGHRLASVRFVAKTS